MLKKASCNGKWQMEDGKPNVLAALFHLPSSIFHSGRGFSAAC
jgi:hypothetical protein